MLYWNFFLLELYLEGICYWTITDVVLKCVWLVAIFFIATDWTITDVVLKYNGIRSMAGSSKIEQ